MQLSIEAIIILVIAMVLLGLGIAFISGFFRTGTSKLTEPFNAIEFGCDPTTNDPIKLVPSALSVAQGERISVKVCLYAPNQFNEASLEITNCKDTNGGTDKPLFLTQSQNVKKGDIGGFNTILTAKKDTSNNLNTGTYICTLVAKAKVPPATTLTEQTSKQITITVT